MSYYKLGTFWLPFFLFFVFVLPSSELSRGSASIRKADSRESLLLGLGWFLF
jgi:hypothetical protein